MPPIATPTPTTACDLSHDIPIFEDVDQSPWDGTAVLLTTAGEVVLTWTDDKRDPQYKVSLDAYERLESARDAKGRKLKIHKLPQPGPLYRTREESQGIDTVEGDAPREAGERLAGADVAGDLAPALRHEEDDEQEREQPRQAGPHAPGLALSTATLSTRRMRVSCPR